VEIEGSSRFGNPGRRDPLRPPHHQRYAKELVVEGVAVEHTAVIEELLTVVGSDDQQHLPRVPPLQLINKTAELRVVVGDVCRVPLANALLVGG